MKLHLDRLVCVGLSQIVPTRWLQVKGNRLPILMYHGIDEAQSDRHPYFQTNTSMAAFRAQMQMLAERGYRGVSLEQALYHSSGDSGQLVVITFDDGYADFYDEAVPVLVNHGFTATVYVVSDLTGNHRLTKGGKTFMSWADVRELSKYGIQVGSHTVTHGHLCKASDAQLKNELRHSKEDIEDGIGSPIDSFSYPYAFPEHNKLYIKRVRECLQMYGYKNAVSTIVGTANSKTDPYLLPRLPVNTFDDNTFLQAKLNGGYDWIHTLQYAKKICTARLA